MDSAGFEELFMVNGVMNPFSPVIPPSINVPDSGMVTVLVADSDGNIVDTLVNKLMGTGDYWLRGFRPEPPFSGMVFLITKFNNEITEQKKVLIQQ